MTSTKAALAALLLAPLAACAATNTKGSWACPPERGVPCAGIADIDGGAPRPPGKGVDRAAASADGAGALRWWTSGELRSGAFDAAPRREPDQFAKVLIAGWIDARGDYHAPAEVYALMRRGDWWAAPPATPLAATGSARPRGAPAATDPKAPAPAVAPPPKPVSAAARAGTE